MLMCNPLGPSGLSGACDSRAASVHGSEVTSQHEGCGEFLLAGRAVQVNGPCQVPLVTRTGNWPTLSLAAFTHAVTAALWA